MYPKRYQQSVRDCVVAYYIKISIHKLTNTRQEWRLSSQCPFFARTSINRKDKGKSCSKPFEPDMECSTRKQYQQIWYQIFSYLYRTHGAASMPSYRLMSTQQAAWSQLLALAARPASSPSPTLWPASTSDASSDEDLPSHCSSTAV